MSKLASANFNTLIKILSNASKLDCQATILECRVGVLVSHGIVWASGLSAWIASRAEWLSMFFSFIFESISPDCPWDVAQNKAAGLWSPPPRGISQPTSNNVNYPLLWSERHWNFNYVNSEPFCSKSADCFSIEGNVVPGIAAHLAARRGKWQRRVNSILAWATWGWLLSQGTKKRTLSTTSHFSWHPSSEVLTASLLGHVCYCRGCL